MNSEMFLIDTTIWVLYFKGEKDIEDKVKTLILQDKVAITEIIILETLRGARSQNEHNQLYDDFKALPLLQLDEAAWEESYKAGFKLRRAGITVPLADILIAALATRYTCPLLHRDRHFSLMAETLKLTEVRI